MKLQTSVDGGTKAFRVERWSCENGPYRQDERTGVEFTSDDLDECRRFVSTHPQQWAYLKVEADLDRVWELIKEARK